MSGNVDSVISKSGLVENVGAEVEIASISQSVQMLLPLSFLRPPSCISGFRLHATTMASAPLDSSTSKILGVAVGISILCVIELEIFLGSVATPATVLRVSEIGSGLPGLTVEARTKQHATD